MSLKKIIMAGILTLAGSSAFAVPLTIDPTTGLSGDFSFGGTLSTVQTDPADGWEITVGGDSLIDVSVGDCCVIGDEFALLLDDVIVPWDISNPGAGILFFGSVGNLFLSAGTHTFDFLLTAACCTEGGGSYSFSAVRQAAAAVPEPASLALLVLGLFGLGFSARRKIV